jgi:hypothetical protein
LGTPGSPWKVEMESARWWIADSLHILEPLQTQTKEGN